MDENLREKFRQYLIEERRLSDSSVAAYIRDVCEFGGYVSEHIGTGSGAAEADRSDVASFMLELRRRGVSEATAARRLASLRSFFGFLSSAGIITDNPTAHIKTPKIAKKEIEYLTSEEIEKLLAGPADGVFGIRDRAILELLYATGMRVGEASAANIADLNLRMGFITCTGEFGKARIIPIGRPARAALETYIETGRPVLSAGGAASGDSEVDSGSRSSSDISASLSDSSASSHASPSGSPAEALFLNYHGGRLTRQSLWKILKAHAETAGLAGRFSPQILRNTFAVHMVQNGADLKSLQELMGFEDASAVQIFLSVSKNRIKDVYDRSHPRA